MSLNHSSQLTTQSGRISGSKCCFPFHDVLIWAFFNLDLALEDLMRDLTATPSSYISEAFKGSHEPSSLTIRSTIPAIVHDSLLGLVSLEDP